jgi:serine/threonine protein kinase
VMIMELVEGTTLGSRLRGGPFPASEAVDYISQILSALSYAHTRGIVHRDIKPSNMMLTRDGTVKLMDFGIARAAGETKLTVTGSTLGSLYYMSPEQVQGQQIDARSDLYSLGVSLYELVTARHPFEGDTSFTVMKAHIESTPVPPIEIVPSLSPVLNEIILMAMAKDPEQRYQSAEEFLHVLQKLGSAAQPAGVAVDAKSPDAALTAKRLETYSPPTFRPTPPPVTTVSPAQQNAATTVATKSRPQAPAAVSATGASESQAPVAEAPVPVPVPRSYRVFYIALGSAFTILIIMLTAMRLPMLHSSQSDAKPAANSSGTSATPATPGTSSPQNSAGAAGSSAAGAGSPGASVTTSPSSATPSEATASRKARRSAASGQSAQQQDQNSQAPGSSSDRQAADAAAAAIAENAKAIEELENRFVPLSARASAVKGSFENLRRQQAAAGYSPDSSISTPFHSMEMYLSRADAALSVKDATAAKKNMDLAEAQLSILERRFGR